MKMEQLIDFALKRKSILKKAKKITKTLETTLLDQLKIKLGNLALPKSPEEKNITP